MRAIFVYLILALGCTLNAHALDVYKCFNAQGKVLYSDTPCNTKNRIIKIQPNELEIVKKPSQKNTVNKSIYESVPTGIVTNHNNPSNKLLQPPSEPGINRFWQTTCPTGTAPWVDKWGNNICRDLVSGQTKSIMGSLENCPVGTHPWADSWGNRICKSFGGNKAYYDTSQGCPIGMHPWTDKWGNPICKKF